MPTVRNLQGGGEVFARGVSLGTADYAMVGVITDRGKAANGTLNFHSPLQRGALGDELTVRAESGVTFTLVITSIVNGIVRVSSSGPMPGL